MSVDRPYDHNTVKNMLYDLHIETQRLSEYVSLADRIHRLASEGKVSSPICHDLLMTIGNMARHARAHAKALKLATLRRMESFIEPRPKRATTNPRTSKSKAKASVVLAHRRIRAPNSLKTSSRGPRDPRVDYMRDFRSA